MKEQRFGLRPPHVRTLRDIVEVVAILLAGIWALYVFVYENRIRPTLAPPTPSIAVDMRHAGNDGPLAVIRIDETIHNSGPTEVHFIGHALTVLGSRVVPFTSPRPAIAKRLNNELHAYYAYARQEPVFRDAFVTRLGDPQTGRDLYIEPGQTTTFSTEFYVPRRRFDHLTAWIIAVYSKSTTRIPTTLTIDPSGLPAFNMPDNVPIDRISTPIAELDLNGE